MKERKESEEVMDGVVGGVPRVTQTYLLHTPTHRHSPKVLMNGRSVVGRRTGTRASMRYHQHVVNGTNTKILMKSQTTASPPPHHPSQPSGVGNLVTARAKAVVFSGMVDPRVLPTHRHEKLPEKWPPPPTLDPSTPGNVHRHWPRLGQDQRAVLGHGHENPVLTIRRVLVPQRRRLRVGRPSCLDAERR